MIRVAFTIVGSKDWMGGVTYLKNLLYAISTLKHREIEPVLVVGGKRDDGILDMLGRHAEVLRTAIYDRKTLPWLVHGVSHVAKGNSRPFNRLMEKNGIEVVSHSFIWGRGLPYKTINWIPDFQHLHLPGMFSAKEVRKRNRQLSDMVEKSDTIVLSSYNALGDYKGFAPGHISKARVLQFVSQPDSAVYAAGAREDIERKYAFSGRFFYLPNQFWRHKNHKVVFEAVRILKEKGRDVLLLCTGYMKDTRGKECVDELVNFMRSHGLENNIRLLGMVDYGDVLYLMRNCLSVINPSLFEGWSSTVEEAKSIGKSVVLSGIDVHREQAPPGGLYFDPGDPEELAGILWERWNGGSSGMDIELEKNAAANLSDRTRLFAEGLQRIVLETAGRRR